MQEGSKWRIWSLMFYACLRIKDFIAARVGFTDLWFVDWRNNNPYISYFLFQFHKFLIKKQHKSKLTNTDTPFSSQFNDIGVFETVWQVKFYNYHKRDHCQWGNSFGSIEYECKPNETRSLMWINKETFHWTEVKPILLDNLLTKKCTFLNQQEALPKAYCNVALFRKVPITQPYVQVVPLKSLPITVFQVYYGICKSLSIPQEYCRLWEYLVPG